MQLSGGSRAACAVLLAGAAYASPAGAVVWPDVPEAGYLFQFFNDVDDITVLTSQGNTSLQLEQGPTVDLKYGRQEVIVPAVDALAGSQEAVDAITTASRPIRDEGDAFRDYHKIRHEFRAGSAGDGWRSGYYLSREEDWLAQQVDLGLDRDFLDQHFNLSAGASWGWEDIEPAEDQDTPGTAGYRNTLHLNVVATRVLDARTVLRLGAEFNHVTGLQHNPYRNVYVDGTNVPESHPGTRERGDLFVKLHRWFASRSSLKADYRLYGDDWGVVSHTVGARASQYLGEDVTVSYRYRHYRQGAAGFHRDDYTTPGGVDGYQTGDYRLGPLRSHLFGGRVQWDLAGMGTGAGWYNRLRLELAYERYFNSNSFSANIFEVGASLAF